MTFADRSIGAFLEHVASATVTPSGGAVAAIGGASGAALCEMVCIHTIGKDGYADVAREITEVRDELDTRRTQLLELADGDSTAVDALQAAFETPASEGRSETVQDAAKRATEVPLQTAEECLAVLEHATVVTEKGNRNAVGDAGTGAFLAYGALQASLSTVRLNAELIEDPTFSTAVENRSLEIDDSAGEALKRVRANVNDTS